VIFRKTLLGNCRKPHWQSYINMRCKVMSPNCSRLW